MQQDGAKHISPMKVACRSLAILPGCCPKLQHFVKFPSSSCWAPSKMAQWAICWMAVADMFPLAHIFSKRVARQLCWISLLKLSCLSTASCKHLSCLQPLNLFAIHHISALARPWQNLSPKNCTLNHTLNAARNAVVTKVFTSGLPFKNVA